MCRTMVAVKSDSPWAGASGAKLEVMQFARHSCAARCGALGAGAHVPLSGVLIVRAVADVQ